MKRLFDVDIGKEWTEEAGKLSIEIENLLSPKIDEYLEKGYPIKEIEYLLLTTVANVSAMKALGQQVRSHKMKKKAERPRWKCPLSYDMGKAHEKTKTGRKT